MNLTLIEALAAACGLTGAFMPATKGRWAALGWIAFLASNAGWLVYAWRTGAWFMLLQQVGFTGTSCLGLWFWLIKPRFYWGEWRGDFAGNPTMHIMRLGTWGKTKQWRLDLHKMVGPDMPGCFHTHPAKALRVPVWGGYIEELEDGTRLQWWPGRFGLVRPELSHRIASLPRGVSYSLWLRWPKTHEIQLRGPGWPASHRTDV